MFTSRAHHFLRYKCSPQVRLARIGWDGRWHKGREASNEVSGLVMSLLQSTLNHLYFASPPSSKYISSSPDLFFPLVNKFFSSLSENQNPSSQFLLSKKDLNSCFAGFLGSGSLTNAGGVRIDVSQNLWQAWILTLTVCQSGAKCAWKK